MGDWQPGRINRFLDYKYQARKTSDRGSVGTLCLGGGGGEMCVGGGGGGGAYKNNSFVFKRLIYNKTQTHIGIYKHTQTHPHPHTHPHTHIYIYMIPVRNIKNCRCSAKEHVLSHSQNL